MFYFRKSRTLVFILLCRFIPAVSSDRMSNIKFSGGSNIVPRPPPPLDLEAAGSALSTHQGAATDMTTDGATNMAKSSLKVPGWRPKEVVLLITSILGSLSSILAMLFDSGLLIDLVSILCIIFGSAMVVMQRKLSTLESFREFNNKAREEVLILQASNKRLAQKNQSLEQNIKQLRSAEAALHKISIMQGMSVDALIKQVEEYREIQCRLQESVKDQIRQTLVSVIISSDQDRDYIVDPAELELLCLRLKSIPNIKFDENAFRSAIKRNGGSIMEFSKNHLSDDDVMSREKIFVPTQHE